jgi:hypothetical protein
LFPYSIETTEQREINNFHQCVVCLLFATHNPVGARFIRTAFLSFGLAD